MNSFEMQYSLLQTGMKVVFMLFAFAFGACAGSLINVLVYRLPRGMDVIWAGSQCPCCQTKLTWRENIPVLGWIALGGRCRFCRSKISAEYPLVEALVGVLWAGMFLVYYALPQHAVFLGVDWSSLRPEWASWDAQVDGWPRTTWPIFLVHIFVVASLVAMTLVDAKTFTIPLALPWAALIVGVVFHTLGAAITQLAYPGHLRNTAPGSSWAIPTPDWPSTSHTGGWWWIGASIGASAGLVIANLLLHFNLIRRSFVDYPEWEERALKEQGIDVNTSATDQVDEGIPVGEHVGPGVRLVLRFTLVWLATILVLGYVGSVFGTRSGHPAWYGLAAGVLGGPLLAALACRSLAFRTPELPLPARVTLATPIADPLATKTPGPHVDQPASSTPSPTLSSAPDLWIAYPHARREMLKELIFLTPALALGWLGAMLAQRCLGSHVPPLWLSVLCGTLMGILIGGGGIWVIRIGGSLGFGKEAMGLGDVHLMAGVGACLGWVNALLAIPLAAVVGLYFVILASIAGRPAGKAMPFGPYLAIGTLLVLFAQPLVELGLSVLLRPDGPPIRLP
jgi:prepilin signal peptidase PulO-like enzyme (type II secretory pathway)